ncbi:hypothetical protein TREES_T100001822 [Tupaia chinensis]|uniref:Transmembrane protein 254 n=1 Tax=Tupaia chinensis TaxID=246437 RepID=L9KG88_TUPCH|nr:hypothetical protein TREES_T100001822 [Tupaia chinensis]
MAAAAGDAAYFRTGSLLWFTVITLSFGYYTSGFAYVGPGSVADDSVSRSFEMPMAKSEDYRAAAPYFRTARLLPSLATVLGLGYFAWVVFWPQSIPYQSLGFLGSFTQYLVDHHSALLRNGYKGITNGRAQLLWFLQTFLFGIASLSILIAYRPKRRKQT